MSEELDVNELVNGLLDQVGNQAREIALLRVQLQMALKKQQAGGDEEDVNNTVQSGDVHE